MRHNILLPWMCLIDYIFHLNILPTDLNECLVSNGNCQQQCNNTHGSFECLCTEGWMVDPDSPTSCIGKL